MMIMLMMVYVLAMLSLEASKFLSSGVRLFVDDEDGRGADVKGKGYTIWWLILTGSNSTDGVRGTTWLGEVAGGCTGQVERTSR